MVRVRVTGGGPTTLGLQGPPERLRAAIARHEQLLGRIARRRQVRDELVADTREAANRVGARLHDLAEELRALDAEIHGLMQALCGDRRRPHAQRLQFEEIYRDLEGDVITPRPEAIGRQGVRAGARGAEPRAQARRGRPEPEAPLASSKRPPERGTLRTLFRRLAEAIHPDKVQDEHERLRRTEVMKQVTVAYQDGDYARLIEIERTWVARVDDDGGVPDEPDEVERRLAARERAIAELEAQLAELEREIRAVRASEDGKLAREARRADEVGGVTEVESEAAADVERMRAVRDFIVEFRDGGMTFERFRDGPGGSERSDPFGEPYDDGGDSPFGGVPPGFPPGFDPFAGFPPGFDPFAPSRAGRPGSGRSPRAGAGLDPSTGSPFDALDGAFERAAPPEVVRLLADLERLARAEGVHPRDLLRAIRAAAYGAGPRRRR